ncbi:MAG: ribose-phosphate pyrophosphokinase, partial [Candidatus Hecatellales archaeon]
MLVVAGPSSVTLAEKTAELLGCSLVKVDFKRFPDGESYVRLAREVKGEKVAIIQSTYPPQDSHLLQLFLLVDASLRHGASEVTAVVPYLAYARQDKVFLPYEPVSVEVVLKTLKCLGVKRLLTVNVHSPEALKRVELECFDLSALSLLAEFFAGEGLKGAVAFAPDRKAARLAEEASRILGGGLGWFAKQRDRVTGEVTSELEQGEVEGRKVILFDDIISSGGTMRLAARKLLEAGASEVYAACVHS